VLTSAAVKARFAAMNDEAVGGTPEAFGEHLRKKMVKCAELAKRMGLKPPG
jgi:tripartite-type tricarboxylate transporter receptor subunit TctC